VGLGKRPELVEHVSLVELNGDQHAVAHGVRAHVVVRDVLDEARPIPLIAKDGFGFRIAEK
jgi:hypothetical protein